MARAMCGVQLKDRRSAHLMSMFGLNETIDQLAMANSARWYGHVLRKEDGDVMRMALDFEVEGQRKKARLKMTWKNPVDEESEKVGMRMEDTLCQSKWGVSVNQIAAELRSIWSPSLIGDNTTF